MTDFTLRPGTAQDLALVYSATAKSLRSSPLYRDLPADQYTEVMNGIVQRMLTSPWQLTVATPTGFPTEVAAFVLHRETEQDKPVVGYLYVKTAYRRLGVGRQLLDHATQGKTDLIAVLAQPKILSMCRDKGMRVQLSPYFL